MPIILNLFYSLLEYSAKSYLNKKLIKSDYEKLIYQLSNTMSEWITKLPEDSYVATEAFTPLDNYDPEGGKDEFQKIQQILENDEVPDELLWKEGLYKYWKKKKELLGHEGTNFFNLDDVVAKKHFGILSKKLTKTCEQSPSIFRNTVIKTIKSNLYESIRNIKERFRELIDQGQLENVLSEIDIITKMDDVNYHKPLKEILILFESEISILAHKRKKYKNLIIALAALEASFDKYYYLLLLNKHFDEKFSIETLITQYGIKKYTNELKYIYALKWDKKDINADTLMSEYDDDSKRIIAECKLNVLVNNNKPELSADFVRGNSLYLTSRISKYLCEVAKIQLVQKTEYTDDLTVSGKNQLKAIFRVLDHINEITREFNNDFRSSIQRIQTMILYQVDNPSWKDNLGFIGQIDNTKLFFSFLLNYNNTQIILDILDKNKNLFDEPELISIILKVLLRVGLYEKIIQYENSTNLNTDDQIIINIAKKVIISNKKQDSLIESDIVFEDDDLDCSNILFSLSQIFLKYKNITLANKYFNKLYTNRERLDQFEIIDCGRLAIDLGRNDDAIILYKSALENDTALLVLIKLLMKNDEQIFKNGSELNEYFKKVDIIHSASSLIRQKIQYFNRIGDHERGIELLKKLANKYDNDLDWANLSMFVVETRMLADIKEIYEVLSNKENSPNILLGKMFLSLFIGNNKETRLENFGKAFFELLIKHKESRDIQPFIYSKIYMILVIERLRINKAQKYIKNNTFVELLDENTRGKIIVCIHDSKSELSCEEHIMNAYHYVDDNPLLTELFYKKVGNTIYFRDKTYTVTRIDSIWHYPAIFMQSIVFNKTLSKETGFKPIKITDPKNPLEPIMEDLVKSKQYHDEQINSYLYDQFHPIYILSDRDYKRYIGAIATLLETDRYFFRSGIGINESQLDNCLISFSTILILHFFSKLSSIDPKEISTTSTILNILDNFISELEINPEDTKLSVNVDHYGRPFKYVSIEEQNISQLQFWKKTVGLLKKSKIIDTKDIDLDLTPFIQIIGKADASCIQVAIDNSKTLISDDNSIQIVCHTSQFKKVSNVIPFYWRYTSDSFKSKLAFLFKLSELSYQFIIFPQLISNCIKEILKNTKIIVGTDSEFDIFISLLKIEINRKYNIDFILPEIMQGLSLVVNQFLLPNSELIYTELLSILESEQIKIVHNNLLRNFVLEAHLNFINSCYSKIVHK